MALFDFLSKLLPRLKKHDMIEQLKITKNALEDVAIPNYSSAISYLKGRKYKSDEVIALETAFYETALLKGNEKRNNFILDIESRLSNLLNNFLHLEEQVFILFDQDILRDGLTLKQTILMKDCDDMFFIVQYLIELLDFVYYKEITSAAGTDQLDYTSFLKIRIDEINRNIRPFTKSFIKLTIKPEKYKELIGNMPDASTNPSARKTVISVYGNNMPENYGFYQASGVVYNPIYHVRLIIAQWSIEKHKLNIDKKRMLELRLLDLKNQDAESPSPQIQREISYLEERINKLEEKIHNMENVWPTHLPSYNLVS